MSIKAGEPGSRSSNSVGLAVAIDLHSSNRRVKYIYAKVGVYEIDRVPDDIPRKVLSEWLHLHNSRIQTYAQVLPAFEVFRKDDEAGVREKAVKTLANIGMGMNKSDMVVSFIPIIKGLAGDNLAAARVSACTLLFVPYQTSSTSFKVELRSAYAELCRDGDPLVRREAAANLWRFAMVDYGHFEHDVMSLLEHLAQDADESVRSAAIQSCGALGDLIEPRVFKDHIKPLIVAGSKDTSPLVREMAANHLKAGFAIPIPTLESVLGVIAVGAFVYGICHGVSGWKQLVKSIETNGKEAVDELKLAREFFTSKDCPALIKVYLDIFWKKT